jgi:hypothetical protein
MSNPTMHTDPLLCLAEAICDETATEEDFARLDAIMLADPDALRRYLDYCQLHFSLRLELRAESATQRTPQAIGIEHGAVASDPRDASGTALSAIPLGVWANATHGPVSYFSSGWPVAYLVATVIFAIGLAAGALVHVSHPIRIASPSRKTTLEPARPEPKTNVVGRITGLADCQWKGKPSGNSKSYVTIGDTFTLGAGLVEISYYSGAIVILQGPATYEVDSAAGGYLSIGKLTAKLEKRSEVRGQRSEHVDQKSEIIDHQFAVRTPTAVVTDLGTEFGVEVDGQGLTTSHVFRGLVRVQRLGEGGKPESSSQVLRENESVQVDGNKPQGQLVVAPAARSAVFVREMPKRKIRTFDLVDVVAGGDGFSGRRNAGIDPATGRATSTPPQIREAKYQGNNTYHRVEALPLVDGVFIPNGQFGNVQVDSAGHTFGDFPVTQNLTACYLWAGGAVPMDNPYPSLTLLDGVDYAQPGRGLLFLHANKGITFDLEAIRKANPDWKPNRFCAVVGDSEKYSEEGLPVAADVWVLVDGQVRYRRRDINGCHGAFSIAIPIAADERFLTLVATDGDGNIGNDWIIFGDPRLELTGSNIPVNNTK